MARGKGKAAEFIALNKAQKEEIRRLTQFANRRIRNAHKVYSQEGGTVVPREVVGDYQIKEKWHTSDTPLSRSIQFKSQAEYRKQLKFLQSFERERPGIKEYTAHQREKTIIALETSMGEEVPEELAKMISKLSAPQLSAFWKKYSDKSSKLGLKYSSGDAMDQAIVEFFSEDGAALAEGLATDITSGKLVRAKKAKKTAKKRKSKKGR